MRVSLELVESDKAIEQHILKALAPQCKKWMDKSVSKIVTGLPELLEDAIVRSPEYQSLIGGTLYAEFGLAGAGYKLAQLISIWVNAPKYEYIAPSLKGNEIRGSFTMGLVKADYSDVLGTSAAMVEDFDRGYSLPWLKWLLLDGTVPLVQSYEVRFGPNPNSRTGEAVMVPSAVSWSVPASYAGTINDNWITRAIDSVLPNVQQLVRGAVQ